MFSQQGGRGGCGGCGGCGGERGNENNQEEVAGRNDIFHRGVRCYSCQRHGNYSYQCPNQTGAILTQVGVALIQISAGIKNTWVLLYTCATNSISNNASLVTDVISCKKLERLTVSTNGGLISFDKNSTLKLLPMKVHFNKDSMDTILYFKGVADILGVRITTDTKQERAMTVSLGNGRTLKFKECKSGLYFYDTEKKENNVEEISNMNENEIIEFSYLKTIQENKNFLTK